MKKITMTSNQSNNTNVINGTNTANDGVNVTQMVNPTSIPDDKKKSDLDVLLQGEAFMTGKANGQSLSSPILPNAILSPDANQELDALKLKNPFRGE